MKKALILFSALSTLSLQAQVEQIMPPPAGTVVEKANEAIIDAPEEGPQYPGGATAMQKFINENLQYPELSDPTLEFDTRIYVRFIVEKDGSINEVEIIKGTIEPFGNEAARVVGLMPKWEPGKVDGQAVRTRMLLPFIFDLE